MAGNLDYTGFNAEAPSPADIELNSPYCQLHNSGGHLVYKDITITGTNAEVNTNIFSIQYGVELVAIWGVFTDVTEVATLTGAYFDLWDGTNTVEITDIVGTALSGAGLYSEFLKNGDESVVLAFNNSTQARVAHATAGHKANTGCELLQKLATATYVRLRLTTDANTSCGIRIYAKWICKHTGSLFAAV